MEDPEILAILGANPRWKIVDTAKIPDSDEEPGRYVVAESTSSSEIIFGSLGPMCHENGWCVFPQQRTGRRLPSIYRRKAIKWGLYQEERPTAALVGRWARPCFNENVALILGEVSGNTFCLDIDILDWRLALAVEKIAFSVLGETGFRRIGKAPKRALLYRVATPEELPANISRHFVSKDGENASPHGFEILSHKKTLTIYGRHHETYSRFSWDGDYQPAILTPADVPLVTPAQISEFMAKVAEFRPFHRGSATSPVDLSFDFDASGPIVRPRISNAVGSWAEEGGVVVDGREKFLFSLVSASVRANAPLAQTDDGQRQIAAFVVDEFRRRAKCDGRWSKSNLETEALGKVRNAVAALADGRITPIAPRSRKSRKTAEKKAATPAGSPITDGCKGSLAWLPPADIRGPIKDVPFSDLRCDDAEYAARQIPETAAETVRQITTATTRQIDAFLAAVRDDPESEHPTTHAIIAPTGAGKTHMIVEGVDRFCHDLSDDEVIESIRQDKLDDAKEPAQILMLAPAHRNIGETGAKARAAGLDVVEWIGKGRSATLTTPDRCIQGDKIAVMEKAGRNNAVICEKPHPDYPDDPTKTIRCTAWDEVTRTWKCRFKQQADKAKTADLVIAAHAYMTCSAPKAMTDCRAVVIDESFHGQLLKSVRFSDEILLYPRNRVAYRTKREKAEDNKNAEIPEEAFTLAREELGARAYYALRSGVDPVRWFFENDQPGRNGGYSIAQKREMLDLTIALLSRVRDADDIDPTTPLATIERLCSGPERTAVHEEEKFWRLIKDRVEIDSISLLDAFGNRKDPLLPAVLPTAKTDRRILWQKGPTTDAAGEIRLSWIAEHNFPEHHILALDASADKSLLARVLDRKESEIVCEPMDAMLRVRTVHVTGKSLSKTSLLPRKSDTESYGAYKDRLTVELRKLISHTAAMYPKGGIVVCMPQALKNHITDGWSAPKRVIWLHYGNTRGFNVAEKCGAALAIGCLNPSIQQLDDIVAALAHGEENPEPLRDPLGEHRGFDLDRIYKTDVIKLRNGHTMEVTQAATEGRYSEMALRQIRQEEHLQFLGRLRPIRRDEITDFINVGSYIPPSLIVDEVVEFEDLMLWIGSAVEVAREHQGPIGAGDTLEEAKAAKKFSKILEAGETRKNFFEVTAAGEVLYVPAHTPAVIDRMVEDGYQITHRPTLGIMEDFPAPLCTYADEVRFRDRALAAATADGWSAMPGSRMWTRETPTDFDPTTTNDRPVTTLDVAVLAQHYHVRLRREEREAEKAAAPKTAMEIFETEVF
ncbi:MAG: bifunctional DNA primase/polymerase [Aurantimonas coralicida]